MLSGDFKKVEGEGPYHLRLTRFEMQPGYSFPGEAYMGSAYRYAEYERQLRLLREPGSYERELDVPAGVGIEVVLSDESAFTSSGRERIDRGEPFYGRVIAHSPSFNPTTGELTCSAYAVWGVTRSVTPPYVD